MKHEQVVVDYWIMAKTSCTCLLLALSGYILLKMLQTIFWLPGYLQKNQERLEELAAHYSVDLNADVEEEKEEKEERKTLEKALIVHEENSAVIVEDQVEEKKDK